MSLAEFAAMQTTNLSQMERLMELYYQPLFRFAVRLCGSPARAMLLTQQTFRQAFEQGRGLPVPANSRAWLHSILFHHFLEDNSPRA
jgi:DNA-directed RNA polymerase specialized sigma24 family protein